MCKALSMLAQRSLSALQHLSLSCNNIPDVAGAHLAHVLLPSAACALSHLDLTGNQSLGCATAQKLGPALACNTTIKEMRLSRTQLGELHSQICQKFLSMLSPKGCPKAQPARQLICVSMWGSGRTGNGGLMAALVALTCLDLGASKMRATDCEALAAALTGNNEQAALQLLYPRPACTVWTSPTMPFGRPGHWPLPKLVLRAPCASHSSLLSCMMHVCSIPSLMQSHHEQDQDSCRA